jgi:hypothetical protein
MAFAADHPWFAALAVPFICAAFAAFALKATELAGLAVLVGFLAFAGLIGAIALPPASGVQKIVWLGVIAALAGVIADRLACKFRNVAALSAGCAAVAVLWVLSTTIKHRPLADAALGGALCVYAAWIAGATTRIAGRPALALPALFWVSAGTGCANLYRGSALLGGLGIALTAALAGYAIVMVFRGGLRTMSQAVLWPVALVAATLGAAGVRLSAVPWYCLLPLAAVPGVAWLGLLRLSTPQVILVSAFTALLAGVTIFLAGARFGGGAPV